MWFIGSAALLLGLGSICLSMKKHYAQVFPDGTLTHARVKGLRWLGWLSLAVGILLFEYSYPGGLGLVIATGVVTVCVFAIALMLSARPRR